MKNRELNIKRLLWDNIFSNSQTTQEKRMLKRIDKKYNNREDFSKYAFYADGLHNSFLKDLVKGMVKYGTNGLDYGRMKIFQANF